MAYSRIRLADTVILTGAQTDVTVGHLFYTNTLEDDDAHDIVVIAPAVLVETCNVQVSVDNVIWDNLQHKYLGTDLAITAGKATIFDPAGLFWRLKLTVNATNNYTFQVVKRLLATGPAWN